MLDENNNTVTFADVAGMENSKQELQEIVAEHSEHNGGSVH